MKKMRNENMRNENTQNETKQIENIGIDWKRKLTSRKFWAAAVGFVTPLIIAFGGDSHMAAEVAAIIMAGAACLAYIIGEGLVDAAANKEKPKEPGR
jgi:hypothetical protein